MEQNNPFAQEFDISAFEQVEEEKGEKQPTKLQEPQEPSTQQYAEQNQEQEQAEDYSEEESEQSESEQDDTSSEQNEEESLFQSLSKQLDLEEINKEYDETVEGVAEFAKDYAKTYYNHVLEQEAEEDPFLHEYRKFKESGGDINEFLSSYNNISSYESLEVGEGFDNNNKKVITDYFKAKGFSQEDIDETVEAFEMRDKLASKAEEFKPKLVDKERKELSTKQQEQEQQQKEQQEFNNNFNKHIEQSLKKGKIGNYQMSKDEKDGMVNFLMKADEDGLTPYQKSIPKNPQDIAEMELMQAYIKYKNLSLSDLKNIKSAKPKQPAKLNLGTREKGGSAAKKNSKMPQFSSPFMKS